MTASTLVDRIRQPEYTGENRCMPCTIVNVVIAAGLSLLLGFVWAPLVVISFAIFVAAIYTRGYLVPGTPTLTKRYFPDRVLRWFDKEPSPTEMGVQSDVGLGTGEKPSFDVEAVLQEAGALEPCEDIDDLCLTADFESEWAREIERTDDAAVRKRLASILGVDEEQVTLKQRDRWFAAAVDGVYVGQWDSHAALTADVATDVALEPRLDGWDGFGNDQRSALARGLRIYLDSCPDCGGNVEFGEETAESCCRSWEVLVIRCDDCGSRLFEIDLSEVEEAPA
ncbi:MULTISPECIES: hypothetical protein [Haloferax]|uniref:Uncharacterized protein n=1 Tax=Haloferax marinum TaxID=2666143 RepID=A0A6A8G2N4_9EURY|nr:MULTISPECIES: hypothetical protein [Haloferax]KAB1196059.1 hypothetical protein Hfx1150_00425 [Haloferax sp. CBA1150]MRW95039.1 hypothetical protein [Haloferax marinum]